MENAIKIAKDNEFNIVNNKIDPNKIITLGIGDILLHFSFLKNKFITPPLYINLNYFKDKSLFENPYNALEFRLKLIKNMIKSNNMNSQDFQCVIVSLNIGNHNHNQLLLSKVDNFSLDMPSMYKLQCFDKKYIIFHTKCRFLKEFDYHPFKKQLTDFFKTYKTEYQVILLGEKTFPSTWEGNIHGITTIYDELLNLKNNNVVIDLTKETIYNDLSIDNYFKDMNIIKNAKYNIHFGCGGQFVSSLIFGNKIISFYPKILKGIYPINSNDNIFLIDSFDEYITKLKSINSIC